MMIKINFNLVYVCFKHDLLKVQVSRCSSYTQTVFKAKSMDTVSTKSKIIHHFRNLSPWQSTAEFNETVISSIIYNKDGLIAINKPYGVKIHGHDKPGTRYLNRQRYIIPTIKDCDYTIEDSLPALEKHLNVNKLSILKSSERYGSGIVLLGSTDKVAAKVTKAFNIAKLQKKPHLIYWTVTLGYPVVPYRKERVGIKMAENFNFAQPVIQTDLSKRLCKLKKVHAVHVESRALIINKECSTSLTEIAVSSVKWHFVRVYASSRMAPILGDIMYGSRMKTLLGIPVKVQLQNASAYDLQPLPDPMSEKLNLSKRVNSHSMVPTMIHLRSIILPNFEEKEKDLIITADPPEHFQWTLDKLNLTYSCKKE